MIAISSLHLSITMIEINKQNIGIEIVAIHSIAEISMLFLKSTYLWNMTFKRKKIKFVDIIPMVKTCFMLNEINK